LRRRKVIAAIQGGVLIATLAPVLPTSAGPPLCLGALALLIYSFGADLLWLMGQGGEAPPELRSRGASLG
jgi:hypothetical protein